MLIGDTVGDGGLQALDDAGVRMARDTRGTALVDAAKVLTDIGALPVVCLAALATAVAAAMRRRWNEVLALAAGVGLDVLAVHVAKAAYDRPRPSGSLVATMLSAYPSGHVAYAVTLVACATVLVRAGTGWAVRIGAVIVAIGLVALVAITRVYLGAHYVTDVLGGAALGLAVWSFVAALTLVVGYVRHNAWRAS
jgi:undecaprenyl-diphosphatase